MTLIARGPGGDRLDIDAWTDDDWDEFRRDPLPITCEGCGGEMHTRAIPLLDPAPDEPAELRIFAHNPGEAERCRRLGYDGSVSHDRLKRRIARGVERAGWKHTFEVQSSPTCRADVLATNPTTGKTRALEAQLAALNTADALERHQNYVADFGDCTWVHSGRREWAPQIPSLKVNEDHDLVVGGILIDLADGEEAAPTPVEEVVNDVLSNRILWVSDAQWGTYVLRDAMGYTPRGRRFLDRSRRVSASGATRFCDRVRSAGVERLLLARYGFTTVVEFRLTLDEAHKDFRAVGHTAWDDRHRAALALAYEAPHLKDPHFMLPEVDLSIVFN